MTQTMLQWIFAVNWVAAPAADLLWQHINFMAHPSQVTSPFLQVQVKSQVSASSCKPSRMLQSRATGARHESKSYDSCPQLSLLFAMTITL